MAAEVDSRLPPELLEAIAHPAGGRVVLVVGAGCSVEPPTRLPAAGELAGECHRKLIIDRVIDESACSLPGDLSAVADAVVSVTGSQRALVERFPPERFRNAEPNEGHFIAASLLREGAVSSIMTLKFDLALSVALVSLGATEVATISGPEDHRRLSLLNLIYLHRSIDSQPDSLILRTEALENEWKDHWEEVVARRVMTSSVTVMVGLGSPAAVLVETIRKIVAAFERDETEGSRIFVVGPSPVEGSAFFSALGLPEELYVQLSWIEFMRLLAARVVVEQLTLLERACRGLAAAHDWEEEDVSALCRGLGHLGLVGLGRLRARWLLEEGSYLTNQEVLVPLVADLLLGVAMVERLTGAQARLREEGVLEFDREGGRRTAVLVCSGRGYMRWALMQAKLDDRRRALAHHHPPPHRALVSGVLGGRTSISTPADLVAERPAETVLFGPAVLDMITVDELRADPSNAKRLVS